MCPKHYNQPWNGCSFPWICKYTVIDYLIYIHLSQMCLIVAFQINSRFHRKQQQNIHELHYKQHQTNAASDLSPWPELACFSPYRHYLLCQDSGGRKFGSHFPSLYQSNSSTTSPRLRTVKRVRGSRTSMNYTGFTSLALDMLY